MTKPGDPKRPTGDDPALSRLEKALKAAEALIEDQKQRLRSLGVGREESMRALADVRNELKRVSKERDELRIVERLTRTANDTIEYEIAVEDAEVLVAPWKAAFPLQRDEAYRMFEYACHEDNSAIRNFIETSRFERRSRATP